MEIQVENLKCGGCSRSIVQRLSALPDVADVRVDVASGMVTLQAADAARSIVVAKLSSMGYPEAGTVQGLSAAVAGAKSFVSCAIGRIG